MGVHDPSDRAFTFAGIGKRDDNHWLVHSFEHASWLLPYLVGAPRLPTISRPDLARSTSSVRSLRFPAFHRPPPPAPIDDRQARARRAPAPIRDMSEPSSTPSGDLPHRTRPTCSRGVDSAGFGPLGWPDRLAKQRRAADPGRCLVRTARFRAVAARLAGPAARWTQCSRQAPAGLATSIGRTAVSCVTAGLGHGSAPAGTDPLPGSPRRTTAARPAR